MKITYLLDFVFPFLAVLSEEGASKPVTVMDLLKSGGWVILPLFFISFLVVALIFYYFASIRLSAVWTKDLDRRIENALKKQDLLLVAEVIKNRSEGCARLLKEVLNFLSKHKDADLESVTSVAEAFGSGFSSLLNQRILYLLDAGVIAPMLGLFGTVIGILRSFGSIAAEPSPMRTLLLAGGVSQALVSTAIGLIVGISAMFFYSFFRGRVQYLISVFEERSVIWVQEIYLLNKKIQNKLVPEVKAFASGSYEVDESSEENKEA
ncbi:biopolymer transporter [Methylacidiphilum sp. Yel]|jgi:biopolymer transport protein ExbB|uniref:MotA/TolQ/ExbB proton channel family protein n=1 Tax=Methylacidiphilum sp. Yel TaxID=1847730 RepID=UPI00106A5B06|nr:MotA/TolQ/ExbB proton channel family protein [Methylacidiphilum sp. Yel]TFE67719.1 biopolymer transporter [Methylacidiphilum sp. Yel]